MNNKEIHNRIKNSKKEANKIWDELFYCEEIEVSTKKSNKKNVHNTVKKNVPPVAKTKSFSYINNIFNKEKTKYKNIREKLEVTGFINENDFIEYNVSDESKMRALMQSMNISTKDKQFFPVSGNPKNKEHFKRPLYGFSWNKEDVRINFDEVRNGCKRSYTIECSNRQITDLNIPSIRKKGTFGFVPPEGYVVLDIDDMLDAIFIRDYVEKNNIRCDILQTTHGIHFIFKYTEDGSIKNNAKKPIKLNTNILADYRTSHGYIVLPNNIAGRKYLKICNELDEIPNEFKPHIYREYKNDKTYNEVDFEESEEEIEFDFENYEINEKWYRTEGSRDDTIYRFLCGIINDKKMWYYPNFEMMAKEFNKQCLSPMLRESEVTDKAKRIFQKVKNGSMKVKETDDIDEYIKSVKNGGFISE